MKNALEGALLVLICVWTSVGTTIVIWIIRHNP